MPIHASISRVLRSGRIAGCFRKESVQQTNWYTTNTVTDRQHFLAAYRGFERVCSWRGFGTHGLASNRRASPIDDTYLAAALNGDTRDTARSGLWANKQVRKHLAQDLLETR